MKILKIKRAFTLVELIIVIVVLAILSTIGFISYSGYLAGVRDANRIAQINSISKGLLLYTLENSSYPLPDDYVEIKSNGKIISYQGYAGKGVLGKIGYSEEGLDPKDKIHFSYYLTRNKKLFELMALLEEKPDSLTIGIFKNSYALNYLNRYPYLRGNKLGVITNKFNVPLQIFTGGLDIANIGDMELIAHIGDEEVIEGTGDDLAVLEEIVNNGGNSDPIDNGNAVCGSSQGLLLTSVPTENLCEHSTLENQVYDKGVGQSFQWSCKNIYNNTTSSCDAYYECSGTMAHNISDGFYSTDEEFCLKSDSSEVSQSKGYGFKKYGSDYVINSGITSFFSINSDLGGIIKNNNIKYVVNYNGTGVKVGKLNLCNDNCSGSHSEPFGHSSYNEKIIPFDSNGSLSWYICNINSNYFRISQNCSSINDGSNIDIGSKSYSVSISGSSISLTESVNCYDYIDEGECNMNNPPCLWDDPTNSCVG